GPRDRWSPRRGAASSAAGGRGRSRGLSGRAGVERAASVLAISSLSPPARIQPLHRPSPCVGIVAQFTRTTARGPKAFARQDQHIPEVLPGRLPRPEVLKRGLPTFAYLDFSFFSFLNPLLTILFSFLGIRELHGSMRDVQQ